MATEPRLTYLERLVYGGVFATSLTVALAWSPFWERLGAVTAVLPPAQAALIDSLPGRPNTVLAFFALVALSYAVLFFMREPTPGLGVLAAATLATAAYPYGQVLWHRLLDVPVVDAEPTVGAWVRALVPVLLLLVPPVVAHLRAVSSAYRSKKVEDAERLRVVRHLGRSAGIAALFSVGIALLLGAVIGVGSRIIAGEARVLGQNSALVLLVAALLLVFGLGIGTDLFARNGSGTDPSEDTASTNDTSD